MADKLYTGAITELIDWANGTEFNETNLDSKTTQEFLEAYEDGEYDGISGASIRNLLQKRLLYPIYNYSPENAKEQILFPSQEIQTLWAEKEKNSETSGTKNPYYKYVLVSLPKPSAWKFVFAARLIEGKTNISQGTQLENLHDYYIIKSGDDLDVALALSYFTQSATDGNNEVLNEAYNISFTIEETSSGVKKNFSISRSKGVGLGQYDSELVSIGSYLKTGENILSITIKGMDGNDVKSSGLTSNVLTIGIHVVSMDLTIAFTDTPPGQGIMNLNVALSELDETINTDDPKLYINYNLYKTISGTDERVHFAIHVDADVPSDQSSLTYGNSYSDESSPTSSMAANRIIDHTSTEPTFLITAGNNDTNLIINKNTVGGPDGNTRTGEQFFQAILSGQYRGQHSMQIYAYVIINEQHFVSNTVYFTFNIVSNTSDKLYANIYYPYNNYPNHYITASNRYILCKQYSDVNIAWSIYASDNDDKQIEWDLEYTGNSVGHNQKLTTQVVNKYSQSHSSGTYLSGKKGIQFIPLYTDTASLNAYYLRDIGEDTLSKTLIFSIPVYTTAATYTISEADGYSFKLSAYSKANYTQDQESWVPINSQGTVPKISASNTLDSSTIFHNVNFRSDSTGWVNHGLNIYGIDSYALIQYNALEYMGTGVGRTIEIEFETMRVQSDDDILLKIGGDTGCSIIITPTKAYVAKDGIPTSALTNYKINERMRLAFVFNKFAGGEPQYDPLSPDDSLIYIINNGILERSALMSGGAQDYSSEIETIQIGNKDKDKQINGVDSGKGSGIIVYNIKVYKNKALSYTAALQNYIIDAPNKGDIINRNRAMDFAHDTLLYEQCCNYIPTFLITGDLTNILNILSNGQTIGKEASESNVGIIYKNPYDPTRNFSVDSCQIRKHGQSTLTYPITSMKFWLNKRNDSDIKPVLNWDYQNTLEDGEKFAKNRYIMKRNAFVDDSNLFADLKGRTSIPANKFVLQANFADSSGVHNGAIERLIQLTWFQAKVSYKDPNQMTVERYILRTPPQLFTTNQLNLHEYYHRIVEYKFIETDQVDEQGNPIITTEEREIGRENIERYTLEQAYGSGTGNDSSFINSSRWQIFTSAPDAQQVEAWNTTWDAIKGKYMDELITITRDQYFSLTKDQQDIIDAELCYQGYGKLHSTHSRYSYFNEEVIKQDQNNIAILENHVAGHFMWNEFFPPQNGIPRTFPYYIGVAADSMPCAVFYQSDAAGDQGYQFLGQYVFMEDKKSEDCFGEGAIHAGKGGTDYEDPFCVKNKSQKENNGGNKQNTKDKRLWNNNRVLRIEVLNIDTMFTSFLSRTERKLPLSAANDNESSYADCTFDQIVRTKKDDNGNYNIYLAWEDDFELIYPDPDDIQEDQEDENKERIKDGKDPINNYYESGSEFRKITQPWVDFFNWAVDTTNSDNVDFQKTAAMHLDLWKMAAYYVFFLRFGLVDSVERNAQWKTYDGIHWHCEPWDMDIALGNNNQGQITYNPPMTRETRSGVSDYAYSGSAATYGNMRGNHIWNSLEAWDSWKNDMLPKVAKALNEAGLTYDNINYMFDQEYVYKWSESIYNIGGHFKYIESGRKSNNSTILSWLQGSRETHRHWWLYESMNYYDSLWQCGEYLTKSIQIFTIKPQGTVGGATIKTTRNCLIIVEQNYVKIDQASATQGYPTYVSFKDLSLSTKVPLDLRGSMFFEELDLSEISASMARLDLVGANSAISGGTLYSLNIGTPSTKSSGATPTYTFSNYGSVVGNIFNGYFEHLQTYNIEGQTAYDWDTAQLSSMPVLENLYAKGSGLTRVSFNDLNFKNLELPSSTTTDKTEDGVTTSTTSYLTQVVFNNVIWENLSFWAGTMQGTGNNKTLKCVKVGTSQDLQNNRPFIADIPTTIRTIQFTGDTAHTIKSKDFLYKWLWAKYGNVIRTGAASDERLTAEFANTTITINDIEWSESIGLADHWDDQQANNIQLISYLDLWLIHFIPQANRKLQGYIVIGDSSDTVGTHRDGKNNEANKLTATQMANLQEWFGETIFTESSGGNALQISHVRSYISLSIITTYSDGYAFIDGNTVYLKETENTLPYLEINATKFGERNSKAEFNWKFLYYTNDGDSELTQTESLPETIGNNGTISIDYSYSNRKNKIKIRAAESNMNSFISPTTGRRREEFPITVKCIDISTNIETEADFTVLPKIYPSNVRINTNIPSTAGKMYTGIQTLGIRGTSNEDEAVTITVNAQAYFEIDSEWHTIVIDNDKFTQTNQQKYKIEGLSTIGTDNTQGIITFGRVGWSFVESGSPDEIHIDNDHVNNTGNLSLGVNKPKIDYLIDGNGKLQLTFSQLQDTVYDYYLLAEFIYGATGNNQALNNNQALMTSSLNIRVLNDRAALLESSGTNAYACLQNILSSKQNEAFSGPMYKLDLYLVDGRVNFYTQRTTLATCLTLKNDSVFLYLPNATQIDLYSCSKLTTTETIHKYRAFDFSKCTNLQTLNMYSMNGMTNDIAINISTCMNLRSVRSDNSSITFDYPENSNRLADINIGNPLYIKLKSLPGLTTISGPTNNDCVHLHLEDLKNGNTFTYFGDIYKKLRK